MKYTIAEYIAMGFDKTTAEYLTAGRRKLVSVKANENFTLDLTFDNGELRLFDCRPLLKSGTVFEHIANADVFSRVYLDDTNCVSWDIDPNIDSKKVWSNKIDISSDGCYLDSIPLN